MKQAVLNDGSNGMHFKAREKLRNVPGKVWQDVEMLFLGGDFIWQQSQAATSQSSSMSRKHKFH